MPLYEYRCKRCGERFETLRGFQDEEPEVTCPRCGEKETEKVYAVSWRARTSSSCSPRPMSFG